MGRRSAKASKSIWDVYSTKNGGIFKSRERGVTTVTRTIAELKAIGINTKLTMKHEQEKHTIECAGDEGLFGADIYDDLQKQGVFVLITTRKISKEKLLPLYYMRDQVEKIFELCKQGGKILPNKCRK